MFISLFVTSIHSQKVAHRVTHILDPDQTLCMKHDIWQGPTIFVLMSIDLQKFSENIKKIVAPCAVLTINTISQKCENSWSRMTLFYPKKSQLFSVILFCIHLDVFNIHAEGYVVGWRDSSHYPIWDSCIPCKIHSCNPYAWASLGIKHQ